MNNIILGVLKKILNANIYIWILLCVILFVFVERIIRDTIYVCVCKYKIRNGGYNRDQVKNILLYYGLIESLLNIKVNVVGYLLVEFVEKKWLHYKHIDIDKYIYEVGKVKPSFENAAEEELFNVVLYAAGDDYKLQPNEMIEYVKSDVGKLRLIYIKNEIKGESYKYLWDNDYIKKNGTNEVITKMYNTCKYYSYSFTNKAIEKSKEIYGVYKFIKDYTLLEEKGIEVESYWGFLLKYLVLFNKNKKINEMIKHNKMIGLYNGFYDELLFDALDFNKKEKMLEKIDKLDSLRNKHLEKSKVLFEKKYKVKEN